MNEIDKLIVGLEKYLPQKAVKSIAHYIHSEPVQLTISKPRLTKLGDYRPPNKKNFHRISVNADLNQYHFLWTLIHEFAHYEVYKRYQNSVKPHGQEWQNYFSKMVEPFILEDIFPDEISPVLIKHIDKPKASSCSDPIVYKAFSALNINQKVFLDDLPLGCIFGFGNYVYKKGEKRRTRYMCARVEDNKKYLINGIAEVELIKA